MQAHNPMTNLTFLFFFTSLLSLPLGAEPLELTKIVKPPEVGDGYKLPIKRQRLGLNEKNGRRFYIPLRLEGKRTVKITIWHGHDNSGDKALKWRLMDATGTTTFAQAIAKKEKPQSWTIRNISSLKPVLIIEDADTKFTGKNPGNGFSIAISQK
ncbi:MAG: hypothetical protein ACON5H_06610 [Akkermansiaceae bacterium]